MTSNPMQELMSNFGPKPDAQIAFQVMLNTAAHITNDDSLSQHTYEEYKNLPTHSRVKVKLASLCPPGWTSAARNYMHQQNIWPTPYGYYYIWQFSIPMLSLDSPNLRDSIVNNHREQIDDLTGEKDFARFNHIGRLLYITAYNIHTLKMSGQEDNNAIVRQWYDNLVKYKNTVIKKQMSEASGNITKEQWEFSNEAYDNFEPMVEASFALLDAKSKGVVPREVINNFVESINKPVDYLVRTRDSDFLKEKDIICNDIIEEIELLRGYAILNSDEEMMEQLAKMLSE